MPTFAASIFSDFTSIIQIKQSILLLQKEFFKPEFLIDFLDCVDHILLVPKKDQRVEALVKFIALFVAQLTSSKEIIWPNLSGIEKRKSHSQPQPMSQDSIRKQQMFFSESVLNHLILRLSAQDKFIRWKSVQIIGEIFERVTFTFLNLLIFSI
jgi:hypothetical protein